MTPERWQKITAIFEAALQQDTRARSAYVNEACGDDRELRREVEAMLASHDQASRFIEEPAAQSQRVSLQTPEVIRSSANPSPITRCSRFWAEVEWAKSIWPKIHGWAEGRFKTLT